jgi:AraC-like DNA-binding protein
VLREEGDWAWWLLPDIFPRGACVRQVCEFTLAIGWVYTRDYAAGSFSPRTVRFDHARVGDAGEYERFFGCVPEFEQSETGFEIPRAQLDMPLERADEGLASVLDRYADESVARIPKGDDLMERARHHLVGVLADGTPSLEGLAKYLGVSGRTLQRRLGEEGTTFQHLLDTLRRGQALKLLDDGDLSVGEVAERLGFADSATFRRAFKRWTGASPRDYSRRHSET